MIKAQRGAKQEQQILRYPSKQSTGEGGCDGKNIGNEGWTRQVGLCSKKVLHITPKGPPFVQQESQVMNGEDQRHLQEPTPKGARRCDWLGIRPWRDLHAQSGQRADTTTAAGAPLSEEIRALMLAQIVSFHGEGPRFASGQPGTGGEVSRRSLIKLSAAWE